MRWKNYEMVKAGYPGIGLAAVYRMIQLLLGLHLIECIYLNDGFVRYKTGIWGWVRQNTITIIRFVPVTAK